MGIGKDDAPDPPDYSAIAAASQEASKYAYQASRDQLNWARERYNLDRDLADSLIGDMRDRSAMQDQWAQEDRQRYKDTFEPLENQIIQEAKDYDTPERRQLAAQTDMATVASQSDLAREAAQRNLEGYGIDPSSTRYAALDVGSRTQQAAAMAGAGNMAMKRVEDTGRALKADAVNLGRGYQINPLASSQAATGTGQAASGINLGTTASGQAGMGTGAQWAGVGNSALGTWGNTLNTGYNNALAGYKAQNDAAGSGWGSALGLVGSLAMMKEGGDVATTGGPVPASASPSRGIEVDDVNARLNVGEFVIPKDVKDWKGEEFFHKLIEQSRTAKQKPKQAQAEYVNARPQKPTMVSRGIPA
jgi:hypothetical protein